MEFPGMTVQEQVAAAQKAFAENPQLRVEMHQAFAESYGALSEDWVSLSSGRFANLTRR